jgi:hypothetical protein
VTMPEAPQGVRIQHDDGTVSPPIEMRYCGVEEGLHVWAPVDDTWVVGSGDRITMEKLPALTTVSFPVLWGGVAEDGT